MSFIHTDPESLLEGASPSTESDHLCKEIEKIVLKIFPKSRVVAYFSTNLLPSINIEFTLGAGLEEYPHRISRNDPAHHLFYLRGMAKDGSLGDKLELERLAGGISTFPEEGSYMAMGTHKVSFRKVKGDSSKILKGIDGYFKKLKDELKKVGDNLYRSSGDIDYTTKY